MWAILLVLIAFVVLDKTKVLCCNTLFMSVVYIVGIPLMLCTYAVMVLRNILNLIKNFSFGTCLVLAINILIALPLIILLLYVLIKLCRFPIEKSRFNKSEEEYALACAKRQRTLMWIAFPLLWVSIVLALGFSIYAITLVAGSALIMANPFFWIISILTLGVFLALYVIFMVSIISMPLVFSVIFCMLSGIYTIIMLSLVITALYRMRKRSGYSKLKTFALVISTFIPIWSMISLIEISLKMKNLSNERLTEEIKCQ